MASNRERSGADGLGGLSRPWPGVDSDFAEVMAKCRFEVPSRVSVERLTSRLEDFADGSRGMGRGRTQIRALHPLTRPFWQDDQARAMACPNNVAFISVNPVR